MNYKRGIFFWRSTLKTEKGSSILQFWFKYLWVYIFELLLEMPKGDLVWNFLPEISKKGCALVELTALLSLSFVLLFLICLEKHSQTFPVGYNVIHHCSSSTFMESTAPDLSRGHPGFIKSSAPRKECLPFSKRQGCTWILCQCPFSVFPFHAWQFL
jgi:hypothetical protein